MSVNDLNGIDTALEELADSIANRWAWKWLNRVTDNVSGVVWGMWLSVATNRSTSGDMADHSPSVLVWCGLVSGASAAASLVRFLLLLVGG